LGGQKAHKSQLVVFIHRGDSSALMDECPSTLLDLKGKPFRHLAIKMSTQRPKGGGRYLIDFMRSMAERTLFARAAFGAKKEPAKGLKG
tara:strand:+ start:4556 stop:4822 length:267 start_codon:yes stop_codon:yes gene_type:complete